jgi:hypothetical protein
MDAEIKTNQIGKKTWIIYGLSWVAFMFVIMTIGFPYFEGETITLKSVLIGIVVWTIGGLAFGYIMKKYGNNNTAR